MKYETQVQSAMERLDQSLARLQGFIKTGRNGEALQFMDAELKERYQELQNMITLSSTGTMGARGVNGTQHI
jgi:hypothetical protein|tara:strand:+ start:3405 stop:3620 length:216 start_codon:yes stop_codon:yes gene_type:complete